MTAALLLLLALVTGPTAPPPSSGDEKLVKMYIRNGVAELGLDERTPEGREKIAKLERAVREELRDRALVEHEARRRNLPIAERLDARKRQWIARLGGEPAYLAYLAEHQLTDHEFQRVLEQELAGELLREALTAEVKVSDAEVAAFYRRERTNPTLEELFVQPERVTASHILIAARTGVHSDIDARRARAEEIRRQLLAGADFGELARRHSDDAGTRARGGDLGPFARETHAAAFDDAAFALMPGQTSAVVRTEYGFHIIRVTAKTPRRVRSLDELRTAIHARLLAQKAARHMRAWLEQQRAASISRTTTPQSQGAGGPELSGGGRR